MDRSSESFTVVCHNFSDIRRRPLVIGKLDQVRLPFVVTMPQLAVGALTFGLAYLTRAAWGSVMSDRLHIVVFVVVPIVVAQQVSRTSVEGRTLSKAALGFLRLWTAPRHGEMNGRRLRRAGRDRVVADPIAVDVEPTGPAAEPAMRAAEPAPRVAEPAGRVAAISAATTTTSRRTRHRRARQALEASR